MNAKVYVAGIIGKDQNGKILRELLEEKKVDYYLLERDLPTITKVRIIGGHQQIVRIDFEEIVFLNEEELKQIKQYIMSVIDRVNCLVISDYGKGVISPELSQFIIREAQKRFLSVVVDPKGKDWTKYKGATVITPNIKELSDVLNINVKNEDDEVEKYGREVKEKYNLKYLELI